MSERNRSTIRNQSELLNRESYLRWIEEFDWLEGRDRQAARRLVEQKRPWPAISVVMPVYETDEEFLRHAIDSVRTQVYPHWELCIADDASPSPHIRRTLTEYQQLDPRIHVTFRSKNGSISAASNSAFEMATGDFVAMLDHDDVLSPHALLMVALETKRFPDVNLIYTDSDNLDAEGQRRNPFFKPDWNYELLLGQNYVNHLTVIRRRKLQAIGGFRAEFEGSQDYDLLLRLAETIDPLTIRHIPHVLYHWRIVPSSFARTRLGEANRRARLAIKEHLHRCGHPAEVEAAPGAGIFHRVRRDLPVPPPAVSVIVTSDAPKEVAGKWAVELLARTKYPHLELIVAASHWGADDIPAVISGHEGRTIRLLNADSMEPATNPFNSLVRETRGEVLVLLDELLNPVEGDWIHVLVGHAVRREIGLVGAKIVDESGKVQNALSKLAAAIRDVVTTADTVEADSAGNQKGYFWRWVLDHRVPAVSGGCLAVRKSTFESLDGFDGMFDDPRIRDTDFSKRITQNGLGVVWCAHAQLVRPGPLRAKSVEVSQAIHLVSKWGLGVEDDLCDHPDLIAGDVAHQLLFPPRSTFPWRNSASRMCA